MQQWLAQKFCMLVIPWCGAIPNRGWSREAQNLQGDHHHNDCHCSTTVVLLEREKNHRPAPRRCGGEASITALTRCVSQLAAGPARFSWTWALNTLACGDTCSESPSQSSQRTMGRPLLAPCMQCRVAFEGHLSTQKATLERLGSVLNTGTWPMGQSETLSSRRPLRQTWRYC